MVSIGLPPALDKTRTAETIVSTPMSADSNDLDFAAETLREAKQVVVFTGAGISAESGIPTFRDDGGFWERFPVEEFATWKGIARTCLRQPRRVAEFVYHVIGPISAAEPNVGHRAIAYLEKEVPTTVVTQNIDGLHQAANSSTVLEVHGSMFRVVSLKGDPRGEITHKQFQSMTAKIDRLRRGWFVLPRLLLALRSWLGVGFRGVHRPKLVLFGDAMSEPDWSQAVEAAMACDCLIQVGCSGMVYPAALLPDEARKNGATIIAIDPNPADADIWLQGSAGEMLPQLMNRAFGNHR